MTMREILQQEIAGNKNKIAEHEEWVRLGERATEEARRIFEDRLANLNENKRTIGNYKVLVAKLEEMLKQESACDVL